MRRLPVSPDGQWRVDPNPKPWQMVKTIDLEEVIARLFNPAGSRIPDTALPFFAGHGLRKYQGGISEVFLATSDAHPPAGQWGV